MFFRLITTFLTYVPLRVGWLIAWGVAWFWWVVVPVRRKFAADNFHHVFPDRAPGPDLRRMMHGLILGYIELFHELRKPTVKVEMENPDILGEHLKAGKGALLMGGHFGSWDLLGPLLNRETQFHGAAIVKVPKVAAVAEIMEKIRRSMDMDLITSADSAMEEVYKRLAAGRLVCFVLDQRYNRGIPIDFFGREAWTTPALARAAKKAGVPVFTLHYWRVGLAHHRAEFEGPLDLTGEIEADTRIFQQFYEEKIRQRPHNWFWLHNRWRKP
jgi:KDO2-lipid IV(A) lauroyltransferase